MNKNVLLAVTILFATISTSLKSQDYIPFPPDSTSEWRIDEQWWNPYPWEITTVSYRMYFDGTEQIGDLTFNLLYADGESVWNPPNGYPPVVSTFEHEYLGRICTHESKVYFNFPFPDNLIFDYSWQVGDTVQDCSLSQYCEVPMVIDSIDSLLISDRYHLRYNFVPDYGGTMSWFVEGIGQNFGIWHMACMVPDMGSYFYCYAENGEPIYPEDANCILTVGMDEPQEVDWKFEIYPNPATTQITLSTNSITGTDVLVQVSDLTGRLLIKEFWKQNMGSNTTHFNLSTLKPGIYFITISGNDPYSFAQQKLIVK